MEKKALTTSEEIENLTAETYNQLENWQIASLDRQQIIRLTQRKLELGFELDSDEKTLLHIPLSGKEITGEIISTIISIAFMFGGVVVLWWLMF